jgi:hypothetical protein
MQVTPVTRVRTRSRHMTALHAYAMANVRNFGRPDLFFTHLSTDREEITRLNPPVRESVIDDLGASAPPVVGPARVYAIVRLEAQSLGVVHMHTVTLVFGDIG